MLEKVEYVEGIDKSALDSLNDKQADCQGRSMLFIALCRANKIPARMVWVDGHAYAEFYLESEPGKGYWYPIESAGTRAFGEMPLARTILQKGDNFRVPERKERLRYASDYMHRQPGPRQRQAEGEIHPPAGDAVVVNAPSCRKGDGQLFRLLRQKLPWRVDMGGERHPRAIDVDEIVPKSLPEGHRIEVDVGIKT